MRSGSLVRGMNPSARFSWLLRDSQKRSTSATAVAPRDTASEKPSGNLTILILKILKTEKTKAPPGTRPTRTPWRAFSHVSNVEATPPIALDAKLGGQLSDRSIKKSWRLHGELPKASAPQPTT